MTEAKATKNYPKLAHFYTKTVHSLLVHFMCWQFTLFDANERGFKSLAGSAQYRDSIFE
jgi:hypothetical protein